MPKAHEKAEDGLYSSPNPKQNDSTSKLQDLSVVNLGDHTIDTVEEAE